MAENNYIENPVEKDNTATAAVPQEEYQKLYTQAINLETRFKRLIIAYNTLLDLYLSSKE